MKEEFLFHIVTRYELLINSRDNGALFLLIEKVFNLEKLTRICDITYNLIVDCKVLKKFLKENNNWRTRHIPIYFINKVFDSVEFDNFDCMFSKAQLFAFAKANSQYTTEAKTDYFDTIQMLDENQNSKNDDTDDDIRYD